MNEHPPCPECDPSLLPAGLLSAETIIERPDGSHVVLAGAVRCYFDDEEVTEWMTHADPARGVAVLIHGDGERYHPCAAGTHICKGVRTGAVRIVDSETNEAPVLAGV